MKWTYFRLILAMGIRQSSFSINLLVTKKISELDNLYFYLYDHDQERVSFTENAFLNETIKSCVISARLRRKNILCTYQFFQPKLVYICLIISSKHYYFPVPSLVVSGLFARNQFHVKWETISEHF